MPQKPPAPLHPPAPQQPPAPQPDGAPRPKRLLDQMADLMRVEHLALSTERSYLAWVRRFILFHHKRHPTR